MEALVSAAFKATPSIESAASPQQKWSQTKASLALEIIIIIEVDVEVQLMRLGADDRGVPV